MTFGFPDTTTELNTVFSLGLFLNGPPVIGSYSSSYPHSIPNKTADEPAPSRGSATTYVQMSFRGDWCTYSYVLSKSCASDNRCTYTRSHYRLETPSSLIRWVVLLLAIVIATLVGLRYFAPALLDKWWCALRSGVAAKKKASE